MFPYWRATIALVLIVAGICLGVLWRSGHEQWVGTRTGLAYFGLLAARAFSDIHGQGPPTEGLPLSFEANLGQAEPQFQYVARGLDVDVFLGGGAATISLHGTSAQDPAVVRASFAGGARDPEAVSEEPLPGHVNYFFGRDHTKWVIDAPTYRRIRYRNVYPGIDAVYYGAKGVLEHDFIVHPGADPALMRMKLEGADRISINAAGAAELHVKGRLVEWKKPVLYQEVQGRKVPVEGRFRLTEQGLGFETGHYDPNKPLVIDPVVSYATYYGGSSAEAASRAGVDAQGNVYLAGYTRDSRFAAASGTQGNASIIKINPAGSAVLYATYIGGASGDVASGMSVDASGNVYITGVTQSEDYPVTAGAVKTQFRNPLDTPPDAFDCIVTKLNPSGNGLVYSTYLGGKQGDWCSALAVDGQGNAYVTGSTLSTAAFPVTANAFKRANTGLGDAFVVKLNPTGTQVVYGTYLGGANTSSGLAIAVDGQGAAYVTGQTTGSLGDAFVAKVAPDGSALQYFTNLGGKGEDIGSGIAVDSRGNAYVVGATTSQDFPISGSALQRSHKGAGRDAFIAILNPGGTLVSSTYLGGSKDDWATSVAVDSAGAVWVTGATLSPDFPVSSDATQRTYAGSGAGESYPAGDVWVAQVSADLASLPFSTYLGGSGDEYALSIALDSSGNVWVAGSTRSANFPVTAGALQSRYGGTDFNVVPLGDSFLARITAGTSPGGGSSVSIGGIVSAASYAGEGVAAGEIVYIGGTNIGPASLATLALVGGNRVSTSIGNTQVLFDNQPAPLLYVSATQGSAIVPYSVAGKSTTQMVIVFNGTRSAPMALPVVASHPALFSATNTGRGQGAILNENLSVNSRSNPSDKGRVIALYGTGEGQTMPAGTDGLLALLQFPKPVAPVSVTIGGQNADVLYAGAAPQGVAGLFQVNAKVPESVASGDLEVVVQVGTARSQSGLTAAVR